MSCSSASVGFWPSERITVPAGGARGGRRRRSVGRARSAAAAAADQGRAAARPRTELLGRDRAVAILVEQGKGLLELGDLGETGEADARAAKRGGKGEGRRGAARRMAQLARRAAPARHPAARHTPQARARRARATPARPAPEQGAQTRSAGPAEGRRGCGPQSGRDRPTPPPSADAAKDLRELRRTWSSVRESAIFSLRGKRGGALARTTVFGAGAAARTALRAAGGAGAFSETWGSKPNTGGSPPCAVCDHAMLWLAAQQEGAPSAAFNQRRRLFALSARSGPPYQKTCAPS